MKNKFAPQLAEIQTIEDQLSLLISKLWKDVNPNAYEIETVRDVLAGRHGNYDPTDLDVAKFVIQLREN